MIAWYDRIGNGIEMKLYKDADRTEFEWVHGNVIKGYRYQDGMISMKSDDGRIIWCGVESGDLRKSDDSLGDFISNADRIRSMTDEELAEFIINNCDNPISEKNEDVCEYCEKYEDKEAECDEEGCKKAIVKWLQSESEE